MSEAIGRKEEEEEKMAKKQLTYAGWGIVGEPKAGVIVDGPAGPSIDVRGYSVADYFDGTPQEHGYDPAEFLGPDIFGIVPIFLCGDGSQFPAEAQCYPFMA